MSTLRLPRYDPEACSIGAVHLGFGAFHRAHQADCLDRAMEATGDLRWGVAAVNLRPADSPAFARTIEAVRKGGGYVLKTVAPTGRRTTASTASTAPSTIGRKTPAPPEEQLADPRVHLATVTVTESGYASAPDSPDGSAAPAAPNGTDGPNGNDSPNGSAEPPVPAPVFRYLEAALNRRREADAGPITLLCCDNIRANGRFLRNGLLAHLRAEGADDPRPLVRRGGALP